MVAAVRDTDTQRTYTLLTQTHRHPAQLASPNRLKRSSLSSMDHATHEDGGMSSLVPAAATLLLTIWPEPLSSLAAQMRQHGVSTALMDADLDTVKNAVQQSVQVQSRVVNLCTIVQGVGLLCQFKLEQGKDPLKHREVAMEFGQYRTTRGILRQSVQDLRGHRRQVH